MLTAKRKPAKRVSWLNNGVLTLKERLEQIMEAKAWDYADLVRESGESRSVVSQWLERGSKIIHSIGKMAAAERLEDASGFCALWIAKGEGPERVDEKVKHEAAIADLVRKSGTLREVARAQVRTSPDLTPQERAAYLAALDNLEQQAGRKGRH